MSLFADVLANEATANPDGTDIDSNPVGDRPRRRGLRRRRRRRQRGRARIAQGNVHHDHGAAPGQRARAAVPRPAAGTQIPTDAVPTSVVRGPDGAFYISQLTGFPFEKGDANIWRVVPGQAPTVYASGLTNLTDLAFAPDGSLYAVEISTERTPDRPDRCARKDHPGSSQHETIAGGLFAPYGVAFGRGLRLRHHLRGVRRRRRGPQDPARVAPARDQPPRTARE